MKQLLYTAILIIVMFLLIGKSTSGKETKKTQGYDIIIVDKCQYIQFHNGLSLSFVHKGNCSNHKQ